MAHPAIDGLHEEHGDEKLGEVVKVKVPCWGCVAVFTENGRVFIVSITNINAPQVYPLVLFVKDKHVAAYAQVFGCEEAVVSTINVSSLPCNQVELTEEARELPA